MRGAGLVVMLVAGCGGKKAPEHFTVGVSLGDYLGLRLDGSHLLVAGNDGVVDHGKVEYDLPASAPKLAGVDGELVIVGTPCGEQRIKVPLGITPEAESRGRKGGGGGIYDVPVTVKLIDLGLAPKQTRFYFHAPNAKQIAIGKRIFEAPFPKHVDILAAECAPLDIAIDGATTTTAPSPAPTMKEKESRERLDSAAILISGVTTTCFEQRTYIYGTGGEPEVATLTGANVYPLSRSWYDVELEPVGNYVKSNSESRTLTAIVDTVCP